MITFQFKDRMQRVENFCEKTIKLLSCREEQKIKALVSDFERFLSEYKNQVKLTIGFIGQYGAGKSTIIAALTNAKFVKRYYEEVGEEKKLIEIYKVGDKELKIGAQITTDKTETYNWEEVLLIDTPGIYAGRPEHDDITLDQISKSDLLVFVVPNELFNPQSGNFFRKVAQDMQRVGQMVLVINKMSRETGKPEELIKTILQVIEPYHPDDFYTCFIDAYSYLKAQHENDKEEKRFLENESHFTDFLNSLHKLIEKNQLYARLLTPLHRCVDVIERSIDVLSAEDSISRDLLEILRRKSLIFRASQTRLQNSFRTALNELEHKIIMLGENVASMIDGYHKEEEINTAIKKSEWEIQSLSREYWSKLQVILENEMKRLQTEIEELPESYLGRSLAKEFEIAGPDKKSIKEISIGEKRELPLVLEKAPKVFEGLGAFASKVSRDIVYNTVKFFGGKFKPWGAVKATKFINKLGPVLAVIGAIIEIFITIKEEKEKERYEQELRKARAEVRQNFRQIASEMISDFKNGYIDEEGNRYEGLNKPIFEEFYQQELAEIEKQRNELIKIEESKKEIVEELKNLLKDIKNEISALQQ